MLRDEIQKNQRIEESRFDWSEVFFNKIIRERCSGDRNLEIYVETVHSLKVYNILYKQECKLLYLNGPVN